MTSANRPRAPKSSVWLIVVMVLAGGCGKQAYIDRLEKQLNALSAPPPQGGAAPAGGPDIPGATNPAPNQN